MSDKDVDDIIDDGSEDNEFDIDDSGDFNFDDLDDIGDPFSPKPGSRTPIGTVASSAVKKAVDHSVITNATLKAAKKVLPEGYTNALNAGSDLKSDLSNIYDDVEKELKPSINFIKGKIRSNKKTIERVMPKFISKRLVNFGEDVESSYRAQSKEAMEKENIASSISEVFANFTAHQNEKEAVKDATDEQKENVKEEVRKKEFLTDIEMQRKIAGAVGDLVGYQNSVLVNYQKKSLELQHLQYYALKDIVGILKASTVDELSQLKLISHNTSLPNEVKLKNSEILRNMISESIMGKNAEAIGQKLSNLPRKAISKLSTKLVDKAREVNNVTAMLQTATQSMGGDFGPSKEEMIGEQLGEMGTDALTGFLAKRLKSVIDANPELADKIKTGGKGLDFIVNNKGGIINDSIGKDTTLGKILDFIGLEKEKPSTLKLSSKMVDDPADANHSLIHVIPGYLSRILENAEAIRQRLSNLPRKAISKLSTKLVDETSEVNQVTERVVYDRELSRFVSRSEANEETDRRLRNKFGSSLKTDSDQIIDTLDKDKTLSDSARLLLSHELIKQSREGRVMDPKYYLKLKEGDKQDREAIAKVFKNFYGNDLNELYTANKISDAAENYKRKFRINAKSEEFDSAYRHLGRYASNLNKEMGNTILRGGKDRLRDIGAIKKEGNKEIVNQEYIDNILNEILTGKKRDQGPFGGTPTSPPTSPVKPIGPGGSSGGAASSVREDVVQSVMSTFNIDTESLRSPLGKIDENVLSILNLLKNRFDDDPIGSSGGSPPDTPPDGGGLDGSLFTDETGKIHTKLSEIKEVISSLNNTVLNYDFSKVFGKESTFGKFISSATGIGTKMAGGAYNRFNKVTDNIVGTGKNAIFGTAGFLGKLALNVTTKTADFKNRVSDVYVKGKDGLKLAIRYSDLISGEYIDKATGKVIQSIEDIKNAKEGIVDKSGNIVVSIEDIKNGLVLPDGEEVKGMLSKRLGKIKSFGASVFSFHSSMLGTGYKFTMGAFSVAKSIITAPIDVHVKGQKRPTLYAKGFREGNYISDVTGKVISHHNDIDGPVRSKHTGQMLLTEEDLEVGLTDWMGNDIKSTSIKDKVKSALSYGKNIATTGFNFVKNRATDAFNLVKGGKDMLMGMFGGVGKSVENIQLKTIIGLLKEIRDNTEKEELKEYSAAWKIARNKKERREEWLRDKTDTLNRKRRKINLAPVSGAGSSAMSTLGGLAKGAAGLGATAIAAAPFINKSKSSDAPESSEDEGSFFSNMVSGVLGLAAMKELFSKGGDPAKKGMIGKSLGWLGGLAGGAKDLAGKGISKATGLIGNNAPKVLGTLKTSAVGAGTKAASVAGGAGGAGMLSGLSTKLAGFLPKSVLPKLPSMLSGLSKAKTAATVAKTATAVGAGTAAAATGGGIGTAIMTGLGLTNPLGWTILAGTALYYGYKGYKHLKMKRKLGHLEILRMLKYGIPVDETRAVMAVRRLESYMLKVITFKDNSVKFSKEFDSIWEDNAEGFGLQPDNPAHQSKFYRWYTNRFLPVFGSSYFAAKKMGLSLSEIDDEIKPEEIEAYIDNTELSNNKVKDYPVHPYHYKESPFSDLDVRVDREPIDAYSEKLKTVYRVGSDGKVLYEPDVKEIDRFLEKENIKKSKETENELSKIASKRRGRSRSKAFKEQQIPKLTPAEAKATKLRKEARDIVESYKKDKSRKPDLLLPPTDGRVSSPFGKNRNLTISSGKHKGVDIAAPTGTPVYASHDGVVSRSGYSNSYGNVIYLDRGDGYHTRYAHMSWISPNAGKGAEVQMGDLIGRVGSTGNSTGPHLHFELRDAKGKMYNPTAYYINSKDYEVEDERKEKVNVASAEKSYTPGPAFTGKKSDNVGKPIQSVLDNKSNYDRKMKAGSMEESLRTAKTSSSTQPVLSSKAKSDDQLAGAIKDLTIAVKDQPKEGVVIDNSEINKLLGELIVAVRDGNEITANGAKITEDAIGKIKIPEPLPGNTDNTGSSKSKPISTASVKPVVPLNREGGNSPWG